MIFGNNIHIGSHRVSDNRERCFPMSVISRIVVSSVSAFAAAALLAGPAAAATAPVAHPVSGPIIYRPYPIPIRPCGPIIVRPVGILDVAVKSSMVMCPLFD